MQTEECSSHQLGAGRPTSLQSVLLDGQVMLQSIQDKANMRYAILVASTPLQEVDAEMVPNRDTQRHILDSWRDMQSKCDQFGYSSVKRMVAPP